ncbi:hypothetical protein NPIL_179901 [Nephila pilipes]|uniref:Uncharacterized protein n=1 Tax=Nephila pilipes TaxID=299642 RepID=A0A8X6NA36_NEPPI|nr:hypothetical protein NPIL_179901 [Nephila pilipes]
MGDDAVYHWLAASFISPVIHPSSTLSSVFVPLGVFTGVLICREDSDSLGHKFEILSRCHHPTNNFLTNCSLVMLSVVGPVLKSQLPANDAADEKLLMLINGASKSEDYVKFLARQPPVIGETVHVMPAVTLVP